MTVETRLSGLEGLLPDESRLLVSCFDAHHTIGGGLFAIGDSLDEVDRVSSSGMCATTEKVLYRCLWSGDGSPAELVVYDTTGIRRYHRLDDVSAPHDILVVKEDVLVVATTQNEVQCVGPGGEIRWRWRAPGEPDSWHLNSLARCRDEIVVCGFGRFLRRRGWDEHGKPASGRVVSLRTGETVLENLRAPHDPWYSDDTWLVCESAASELVEISDLTRQVNRRLRLPGWPRGVAVTDRYVFVGISPHRHAAAGLETAAVAVVDRIAWSVVGLVEVPGREIYALALAPPELVEGVARGFATNHTRTHEAGQRHMFHRLGIEPRRLWAVGDRLPDDACRASITVSDPTGESATRVAAAGSLVTVDCLVRNTGCGLLTPAPPYPVSVVHRWYDVAGDLVPTERITAALTRTLTPNDGLKVPVRARVPSKPGRYRLRITLLQEGGVPFDEVEESNATDVPVQVLAEHIDSAALCEFGLYPAEVSAACAAGTVEDLVRALLTRPSGEQNGLVRGLIADKGTGEFVTAVATALRCSEQAVRHLVGEALSDPGKVQLTGAEAVALALHRADVGVAFGYAGTSELALCDAFARLRVLVNGRGDRECLFQAGGASRLRPGNGAAVLHGARGLTNALGALADLRRNEIGTVAVVGMPSTGSAPFLPPHAESNLIGMSGGFAKWWYEAGVVPDDPRERAATVDAFVGALRRCLTEVRQPPYGPVLFGVPQDVAEKPWIPLATLDSVARTEPVRTDPRELSEAAALVASSRRTVVFLDDYALAHPGIRPALADFCARAGAPVLQVKYRRGPMLFERLSDVDVAGFIGWYDPSDPVHRKVLESADLLVTVEDRNMYPRVVGPLPACRKLALTSKPEAVHKNGYLEPGDVLVCGDVVEALRTLAGAVTDGETSTTWYPPPEKGRVGVAVPQTAAEIRNGIARAIATVAARSDRQSVLVDDSQMFGGLLAEEYDEFPAGLRVFGGHGGFVGSGITIATGLALGEPSAKVLCSLGDQGFTNSMQGLVAAVQESAPVTFLVCNNGGAVSLRKQSRSSGWLDDGGNSYLDNAAGLGYTDLAMTLGMHAQAIDLRAWLDRDRIAEGLRALNLALGVAVDHPGPALIELRLPADLEFWAGVWINDGFEQIGSSISPPMGATDA
jgi:acetolactate synthase-1/2/3 large subunit